VVAGGLQSACAATYEVDGGSAYTVQHVTSLNETAGRKVCMYIHTSIDRNPSLRYVLCVWPFFIGTSFLLRSRYICLLWSPDTNISYVRARRMAPLLNKKTCLPMHVANNRLVPR
jgi:hypothetical protein